MTQGLAWYGLWTRSDRGLVGSCGVFRGQRCGSDPEIGYEVRAALRGLGFASEAAKAVTDAAHASGNRELWATIRPTNGASMCVVESIGYEYTRTDEDERGNWRTSGVLRASQGSSAPVVTCGGVGGLAHASLIEPSSEAVAGEDLR